VKKILSAVLAVAFLSTASYAVAAPPPAEVVLPAKPGNVTFNHKLHQGQGCKKCHGEGAPGKIALDQAKAHALCTDCHKEKGKGPADVKDAKACGACHKK
jgi:predicted CXXCH cytochrome family protein